MNTLSKAITVLRDIAESFGYASNTRGETGYLGGDVFHV